MGWNWLAVPLAAGLFWGDAGDDWEGKVRAELAASIRGPVERVADAPTHPWPVSCLSIGHTNASYQKYGSEPYFHHGIDIRADAGSEVRASVGGKVVNIENYGPGPAYWEVAILDDEGYLWQYHHVDRGSIPADVWTAFRTGGRVATGAKLGEVYYWSIVTFGERYHHLHLNVLGQGGVYLNPLRFLDPLPDRQSPEIAALTLWKDGAAASSVTSGQKYTVVAEVRDLVLHDKFLVPPHRMSFRVDGGDPVLFWEFDKLPGGSSKTKHVEELYLKGRTCGDYGCRRHVVDLGFGIPQGYVFPRERGSHRLELVVTDFAGNATTRELEWVVR